MAWSHATNWKKLICVHNYLRQIFFFFCVDFTPHHHLLIFNNILWRMPLGFCKGRKEVEFNTRTSEQTMSNASTMASTIIINFDMLCWRTATCGNQNTSRVYGREEKKHPSRHIYSMNIYCSHVIIDCLTQNNFKNKNRWTNWNAWAWWTKNTSSRQDVKSCRKLNSDMNRERVVNASIFLHEQSIRWLCRIIYSEFNRIPLSQWFFFSSFWEASLH